MIIVRPEKALVAESVLWDGGADYVTRQSVTGRGKEMGVTFIRAWLGWRRKSYPFLRKTLLTALIPEKNVSALTRKLIKQTSTGRYGDGKIFLLPTLQGASSSCK